MGHNCVKNLTIKRTQLSNIQIEELYGARSMVGRRCRAPIPSHHEILLAHQYVHQLGSSTGLKYLEF